MAGLQLQKMKLIMKNKLISYDDGFRVLRNIRGSPASWQKMQHDCLAKIRQLGSYNFFMTFLVAEVRWTEIN